MRAAEQFGTAAACLSAIESGHLADPRCIGRGERDDRRAGRWELEMDVEQFLRGGAADVEDFVRIVFTEEIRACCRTIRQCYTRTRRGSRGKNGA